MQISRRLSRIHLHGSPAGNIDEQPLESVQLLGTGVIAALEERLKAHYRVRHAVCVSNCTTGLLAVALALDLRSCEIVVPAFAYGGSFAGPLLLGNKLRFCDVEASSLTLDPGLIARSVTAKTRAILSVDMFGTPADSKRLRNAAHELGLWYISDSAQSFGACREGEPPGHQADATVISFTSGKPLSAGEGGAILTNSDDIYGKLIWYSQHPYRQRRELGLHLANEFGINGRIHPVAARWANARFDHSLRRLAHRQTEAFALLNAANETGLSDRVSWEAQGILPSFFKLTLPLKRTQDSQRFALDLSLRGFETRVTSSPCIPIYRNAAFQAQYGGCARSAKNCPVAEDQAERRVEVHV